MLSIFTLNKISEFADILQNKLWISFFVTVLLAILVQHGVQGRRDVSYRPTQAIAQKLKLLQVQSSYFLGRAAHDAVFASCVISSYNWRVSVVVPHKSTIVFYPDAELLIHFIFACRPNNCFIVVFYCAAVWAADGPEDDEDEEGEDADQVDNGDQEDTAKIDWKPRSLVALVYQKIRNKSASWRRLFEILLTLFACGQLFCNLFDDYIAFAALIGHTLMHW